MMNIPKSFSSLILIILLLLSLSTTIFSKLNNNMFDAKIYINKQMPISRLQAAGHRFSIPQTDTTYQLSGDVYQSPYIAEQKQIYNLSNYKKSQSCTYFKSILEMNSLHGQNLNYVVLKSLASQQTEELFVIGMVDQFQDDRKFLRIYSFTANGFGVKDEVSFDATQLSKDSNVETFMTRVGNVTLFSDGNFLYNLNAVMNEKEVTYSWTKVQGWNSGTYAWKGEEFLGLETVVFQDKELLLFLYTEKIVFYSYNATSNLVSIYLQILNSGRSAFQDVQIGYNNSQLYVLTGNQLLFYSLPNYKTPIKNELAGQVCTRIYIYRSTLHIICEFQKRNFVGQYFYNDTMNVLILNRFYNDIENYRMLSYINNYFLMVGENDIILTSNGVNRKVLLEMTKNAYSQKFVSFGIENILLLNKYDSSEYSQILFAIGQDFIVLFELKFVPAQVWCYIERPPESLQKNILIVRNTSQCEFNDKKQTLKSICTNLKPIQIFFQHYQIESKVTSIVVIVVILLIFVLAFLCLGCVFRENMNYNHMVVEIKKKIKKLQKKTDHEMRQI